MLGAVLPLPSSPQGQVPDETEPTANTQLASPMPAYLLPPSPVLPMETTTKALAHTFLFLLPPDRPWCFPLRGTSCFQRTVSV